MNMNKSNAVKAVSAIVAALMLTASVGAISYAVGVTKKSDKSEAPKTLDTTATAATSAVTDKDETVYVIAGADGSVEKIIVSDWIKNAEGAATLSDSGELDDVKNVKGDESYTINSNNTRTWDAKGNDIYLQGTSNKDLPVDLSLSYTLDGKAISAEELAGKSGKVTIRFDYKNNQYETVKIDGKDEQIYVPFVMLTGTIFSNDNFKNIEVSNGKLINDGDITAVVGVAVPGLTHNLALEDNKDITLPEYVEITADVTDFELTTTVTLATNEIVSELDATKLDDFDSISDDLDKLIDGMNKLLDGSSQLYDGVCTLAKKSDTLIDGVDSLVSGANQLKDGAKKLSDSTKKVSDGADNLSDGAKDLQSGAEKVSEGAATLANGTNELYLGSQALEEGASKLSGGINKLSSGLAALDGNSKKLIDGARKVFDTLLKTADDALTDSGIKHTTLTVKNYKTVLSAVLSSLDEKNVKTLATNTAKKTVTAKVNENKDLIKAGVTAAIHDKVLDTVAKQALGMTCEQYLAAVSNGLVPAEAQAQITAAVDAQMNSDAVKTQIEAVTNQKIAEAIDENMKSAEVTAKIDAALKSAAEGRTSVKSLIGSLDSYNEFYEGIIAYTAGVSDAADGADEIYEGARELSVGTTDAAKGANKVNQGAAALKGGTKDLADGSGELADGAVTLSDGLKALYGGTVDLCDGVNSLFEGTLTLRDGTKLYVNAVGDIRDGAKELSDGITKFNKDGIEKLTSLVTDDVNGIVTRIKATIDVSKNYKSYASSGKTDGNVRFIYKTAEIKADK